KADLTKMNQEILDSNEKLQKDLVDGQEKMKQDMIEGQEKMKVEDFKDDFKDKSDNVQKIDNYSSEKDGDFNSYMAKKSNTPKQNLQNIKNDLKSKRKHKK